MRGGKSTPRLLGTADLLPGLRGGAACYLLCHIFHNKNPHSKHNILAHMDTQFVVHTRVHTAVM